MDIAAVEPPGQWHVGAGQCVPVSWAAPYPRGVFRPEFGLQSGGDLVKLRADPGGMQRPPEREDFSQQGAGLCVGHHGGEPGLRVDQLGVVCSARAVARGLKEALTPLWHGQLIQRGLSRSSVPNRPTGSFQRKIIDVCRLRWSEASIGIITGRHAKIVVRSCDLHERRCSLKIRRLLPGGL